MIGNGNYGRYMSFSHIAPDDKLGCLHLNEINNIKGRFKILNNVNANNNSMMGEEQAELRDHLLSITVNDTQLFIGVKEGVGKNKNNILVIFSPKMRHEAHRWISKNYGTTLTVKNAE